MLTASPSDAQGLTECGPRLRRLVVVLPALNESATVGGIIERVPRELDGISRVQIVVVDDGSADDTAEIAARAGALVITHGLNRGVGAAFASGMHAALKLGAEIIVNLDSDGQFAPEGIPQLIAPILHRGFGFVTCTRFGDPSHVPQMPWIKRMGNRLMCQIVNSIIQGQRFSDVSCGFRAYSREAALRLQLFGDFTYTHETFIDLAGKRVRMTEVPLGVRGTREFGHSRVASNLFRYGFQTLGIILRALRDTRPLLFFGLLSLGFLSPGGLLAVFVTLWYLVTGNTRPWTSLITISTAFVLAGILIGVVALLADQIGRLKRVQEEILYAERVKSYAGHADCVETQVQAEKQ